MAYQVLARKYRPQRFSDVAGQDHVTRTLRNALQQGRIAHGYIFSGHRGIGKTTIARILAMALNCRNAIGSADRPGADPCGVCDSCREIRAGNSVDMMEIDAATNRGIDEIRELRDAARYSPARDRYKIYLLDEAHQITDAAFNALLKTLEEPPDHVVFMMATTQPEDIPPTIRSRCQHFSFHAVTFDDILSELVGIARQEAIAVDDAALALLAEAGDGSMRDALSIMDQAISSAPVVDGRPKIEAAQIRELMGSVPNSVFERLLESIGEGHSAAVMEETDRLLNAGNSPSQLARQFVRYLRNCLMAKLGGETTGLLQISSDERARAVRSAVLFSEEDLTRFLQVMLRTFDELNYRQEQRFHLELGLLKLVHLQRLLPIEQILSSLPGAGRPPSSGRATAGAGARSEGASAPPPIASGTRPLAPVSTPVRDELAASRGPAPPPLLEVLPAAVSQLEIPVETSIETSTGHPPPIQPFPVSEKRESTDRPTAQGDTAKLDLDGLRDSIAAALDAQGHNTAAALLSSARWSREEDGSLQAVVGLKKTMLGLVMNGEAWKIVREALREKGASQKMAVVPGEGGEAAPAPAPATINGSIQNLALSNPLVQRAQELFRAEVRSVLDLREGSRESPRDRR